MRTLSRSGRDRAFAKLVEIDQFDSISTQGDAQRNSEQINAKQVSSEAVEFIAIIESRKFLLDCIRCSVQSASAIPVETYSSVSELEKRRLYAPICLVIISLSEGNAQASANALNALSELVPSAPVVVLSHKNDLEVARFVIGHGAKGYIPLSMGFEIAIEAVRFVLAGGTYVPADCLLAGGSSEVAPSPRSSVPGVVTARELAVVRAIQHGKPNKIIAYELNMCESTVKVHVRNIMRKLAAKNRTEVAIKASGLFSCSRCTTPNDCWSAGRCSENLQLASRTVRENSGSIISLSRN
jgi:DNA-binding NarL/FixJ family response regulator